MKALIAMVSKAEQFDDDADHYADDDADDAGAEADRFCRGCVFLCCCYASACLYSYSFIRVWGLASRGWREGSGGML